MTKLPKTYWSFISHFIAMALYVHVVTVVLICISHGSFIAIFVAAICWGLALLGDHLIFKKFIPQRFCDDKNFQEQQDSYKLGMTVTGFILLGCCITTNLSLGVILLLTVVRFGFLMFCGRSWWILYSERVRPDQILFIHENQIAELDQARMISERELQLQTIFQQQVALAKKAQQEQQHTENTNAARARVREYLAQNPDLRRAISSDELELRILSRIPDYPQEENPFGAASELMIELGQLLIEYQQEQTRKKSEQQARTQKTKDLQTQIAKLRKEANDLRSKPNLDPDFLEAELRVYQDQIEILTQDLRNLEAR